MSANPHLDPGSGRVHTERRFEHGRSSNLLTLTPFYPTIRDDANGCFISEPLEWLQKAGVRNTVFAVRPFYRERAQVRESSSSAEWLRYFSFPGAFGLPSAGAFLFARIVSRVRDLHKFQRIDVVHAHGPLPCGHAAMLLNEELEIPYVVSVHGLDAFSTLQVTGRAGAWCERISRRIYGNSRRVICISERVREQVLQRMGRNCRTSVVYNAVDPDVFFPVNQAPASELTILSVGNLIPVKGHDLLIRAAASLAPEFPKLRWEFIGEGPEKVRLQALTRQLGVADRIAFLGRRARREVAAAMQRCTLFVLPSRYEGLGCVYLEAMACGKPVIGCREQGIAEVIQHGSNGFLVGPGNEKELTLAIAMLLRDPQRCANLGTKARDTILDGFTLAHQAEALARIYREAMQ